MDDGRAPPLIVVTGPEATYTRAVDDVRSAGWAVQDGFDVTGHGWRLAPARLVCCGTVADEDAVEAATLVAARGAGVVVLLRTPDDVGARLFDDLRRIGDVEHRNGRARAPALDDDQRRLLELLAVGRTVAQAAAALELSPRTAARRLAEARAALGVRTTRQAVLRMRGTGQAD